MARGLCRPAHRSGRGSDACPIDADRPAIDRAPRPDGVDVERLPGRPRRHGPAAGELLPLSDWIRNLTVGPDGTIYALLYDGLAIVDPSGEVSMLTTESGELNNLGLGFDVRPDGGLTAHWARGGTVRRWRDGVVTDVFAPVPEAILDFTVLDDGALWAWGYSSLLLYSSPEGEVTRVDVAGLAGESDPNAVMLWGGVQEQGILTVVGAINASSGLVGSSGIVLRGDLSGWEVTEIPADDHLFFPMNAAPSCGGGLLVGGDFGLHAHYDPDRQAYHHLAGGSLRYDLLIGMTVTCGGAELYLSSGPAGSVVSQLLEGNPPTLVPAGTVPGMVVAAACHDTALYLIEDQAIRRWF